MSTALKNLSNTRNCKSGLTESLSLVSWPVDKEEYPRNEAGVQIGLIKHSRLKLTDFGALFVKACIPEKGFAFVK